MTIPVIILSISTKIIAGFLLMFHLKLKKQEQQIDELHTEIKKRMMR